MPTTAKPSCLLCGLPVPQAPNKRRTAVRHPECRRFVAYLHAAIRELKEVKFVPGLEGEERVSKVRAMLTAAANALPVPNRYTHRGRGGRFAQRVEVIQCDQCGRSFRREEIIRLEMVRKYCHQCMNLLTEIVDQEEA